MTKRVSYPKEMRDKATADKKHLVTLDVPGMLFQGPCTKDQVLEVFALVTKWMKEKQ